MPRQSRGRAAPSRPTAAPARAPVSTSTPQTRPASTAAYPPSGAPTKTQQAPPQQQTSQGPGLFGQMASTAAGVAVGSSIGHAIGGWFGGSSAPTEQQQADAVQSSQYQPPAVCGEQVASFRSCMDQNQGDLTICGWYLDQLKACQSAARPY